MSLDVVSTSVAMTESVPSLPSSVIFVICHFNDATKPSHFFGFPQAIFLVFPSVFVCALC
nr:unnamed protein product [Callosobruchus analis]